MSGDQMEIFRQHLPVGQWRLRDLQAAAIV